MFGQERHICVEVQCVQDALKIFSVRTVSDSNGALVCSFDVIKPLGTVLLKQLLKLSFRWQHIFFHIESSQAEDLVEHALIPIHFSNVNLEFFLLLG